MNIEERNDNIIEKNFIHINEAEKLLQNELKHLFNKNLFQEIIDKLLVVTFHKNGEHYIWYGELGICRKLLMLNCDKDSEDVLSIGYNESMLVKSIRISDDTCLLYELSSEKKAFPAFIRNIIYIVEKDVPEKCEKISLELLGVNVITTNKKVQDYVENAIYRKYKLDRVKTSNFANSSSYMGSKKKLIGFIIESIFPHCNEDSVFLDIMCGSGAVANGLAQMGNVYASDAQEFCCLLAKIQGAGFNEKKADKIIKELYVHYNYNLELLKKKFCYELAAEDEVFRMDLAYKDKVLEYYDIFISNYKLYSTTEICAQNIWNEVNERKKDHKKSPYCLFTYYFANVYFSVAQCIQLDSIRYAIDQIKGEDDQEWALGVLVVVTSSIATTFGGHFAQPKRLDKNSIEAIISQRNKSAWLEFSKRLFAIAGASQRYPYEIKTVEGPWENALSFFDNLNKHLVVYLDAPYKREEYSRYYHVLETMVKYDYPESEYKGRLRSKKKGERFSTEFFSKTEYKVELVFERIITEILKKKAICVWSYSDNGAVSIMNVVSRVIKNVDCKVYYYCMPHEHSIHGKRVKSGKARLGVEEYCVVFINKEE